MSTLTQRLTLHRGFCDMAKKDTYKPKPSNIVKLKSYLGENGNTRRLGTRSSKQ
jgi:hypothetical protein